MSSNTTELPSFGEQLRAIRLGSNLTQLDVEDLSREIADREGRSDFIIRNSQLCRIEHGHALPGPGKLLALGKIYGLTLEQLMRLWASINAHPKSQQTG